MQNSHAIKVISTRFISIVWNKLVDFHENIESTKNRKDSFDFYLFQKNAITCTLLVQAMR